MARARGTGKGDEGSRGRASARRTSQGYGEPWIRKGSAEERAGRIREKDHSDELEVFERRREWFQLYHSDRSGWTGDELFLKAVEQAVALERALPPLAHDPGGAAPARGHELAEEDKGRAKLRKSKNPAPRSGLGFVGDPVEVAFDEREAPEGVDVKVALDPKGVEHVELATVRMFRFDEETGAWVLVPRSGPGRDGSYAWVRAHRPGVYAVAGLPAEPALMHGILALQAYRPQLERARRSEGMGELLDALTRLAFAGGGEKEQRKQEKQGPAGADLGLDELDLPRGGIGMDEFRRRLGELELPERGLVEWELLDDFCPVWPWPGRGWPWPPYNWPPRLLWPPILWPLAPTEWTSSGPRNVNGRIKCIAVHPVTENVVWAGAANGGVWKSVTGGATWLPMMAQEQSLAIGAIAVAPSSPSTVYAATGEYTPGWAPSWPGVGVYRTDDSGGTWTLLSPIGSSRCTKVLVHPSNPNVVYVAGNGGLHKSTDGGASWTNVRTDQVTDALMDPTNPDRLYAAVWNSGVYRSTNGGASWTLLSSGIPTGASADWIKLAMGRNGTNGTNFLLAKMGANSGSVYRSTNGGTSWTLLASNVQPASYNEWTNMIAVDPNNQNRILAAGIGLSRSTNGSSFSAVGGTHSDHHQAVYSPESSTVIYLATDGGVYRSTDGGATWALRSYQLVATQLYSLGVSQTPGFRLGGATQDQGIVQTTGSADWVDTGAGNEGGIFVVDPNNEQNVYTTPWSHNLRRSTNGGSSWTNIQTGLGGETVRDLAVRPGNSNHLLGTGSTKVFRSTNQGGGWSGVLTPSGAPLRVAYSNADPTVCYATTDSGRVYRSASAGSSGSWAEPYAAADKPPAGAIAAIAISHTDPNRLYIGYAGFGGSRVWKSVDGGAHWTSAGGSAMATLPNIPVNALAVHHLNADVVYAATDIGVFRSQDGGITWQSFNQGMPRAFVSGLQLRRSSRMLYASTMGRGAYHRRVWFA